MVLSISYFEWENLRKIAFEVRKSKKIWSVRTLKFLPPPPVEPTSSQLELECQWNPIENIIMNNLNHTPGENSKSRPDWSDELKIWHIIICYLYHIFQEKNWFFC